MLIVHRCTTCGQPDYWHDDNARKVTAGDKVDGKVVPAAQRRGCCRRSASWGPPAVAPEWRTSTKELIAEVRQPGEQVGGNSRTCDCDACWAVWMELTGAKRKPRHLAAVPS